MGQAQTECHLLGPPAELRIAIYEYALYIGKVVFVKQQCYNKSSALSLLQTCHQIRDEAQSIYYDINEITLPARQCAGFVQASSSSRLDCLTRLIVADDDEYLSLEVLNKFCLRPLPQLKNLRTLRIQLGTWPCRKQHHHIQATLRLEDVKRERYFVRQSVLKLRLLERLQFSISCSGHATNALHEMENELQRAIDTRRAKATVAKRRVTLR